VSDGVTEAMDIKENLYGADRVNTLMTTLPNDTNVESLKQAMCNDIAKFVGKAAQSDDITFLTLQWTGQSNIYTLALASPYCAF
jgi:sigma-B regulation protein RsbU (phosphoserine phosphatase)